MRYYLLAQRRDRIALLRALLGEIVALHAVRLACPGKGLNPHWERLFAESREAELG